MVGPYIDYEDRRAVEDLERVEGCYKLLVDAGSDLSSVMLYLEDIVLLSAFSLALDCAVLCGTLGGDSNFIPRPAKFW